MKNATRWLAPALAAGLLVAGCSKTDTTTTSGAGGSSTTAAAPTTAAAGGYGSSTTKSGGGDYGKGGSTTAPSSTGGSGTTVGGVPKNGVTVNKATSSFGAIAVDGNGMTLYAFAKDTGSEATCTGGCATAWPPFIGPVETAGDGIDLASLSTTTGSDGTRQVTYKGHPLYHFSGDDKAGDTNGQGIGGVWFAMGADGTPTKK